MGKAFAGNRKILIILLHKTVMGSCVCGIYLISSVLGLGENSVSEQV